MNTKVKGDAYERFVRDVMSQVANQDAVEHIDVRHNVRLIGRSGTPHQIDVYWKFRYGPVEFSVVVEAKDLKGPAKKSQIATLESIINDLPGSPRGVFVSRSGFQSGAKSYAEHNDIILYELREPAESDFEGRIRKLRITGTFRIPIYHEINFEPDLAQMQEQLRCAGHGSGETFSFNFIFDPEVDEVLLPDGPRRLETIIREAASYDPCERRFLRIPFRLEPTLTVAFPNSRGFR
jgi:hypothetical protein